MHSFFINSSNVSVNDESQLLSQFKLSVQNVHQLQQHRPTHLEVYRKTSNRSPWFLLEQVTSASSLY